MFLFFLWGVRRRPKLMAITPEVECNHCNNMVTYYLIREKRWVTLNWIPIIPLKRLYSLICPTCSAARELTKAEFKNITTGDEE
jgi:hypothetical protein